MKCHQCGSARVASRQGEHVYAESGIPHVLLEVVEIRRCMDCSDEAYVIPAMENLHDAIAIELWKKPGLFTREEVRYLLTWVGNPPQGLVQALEGWKQKIPPLPSGTPSWCLHVYPVRRPEGVQWHATWDYVVPAPEGVSKQGALAELNGRSFGLGELGEEPWAADTGHPGKIRLGDTPASIQVSDQRNLDPRACESLDEAHARLYALVSYLCETRKLLPKLIAEVRKGRKHAPSDP